MYSIVKAFGPVIVFLMTALFLIPAPHVQKAIAGIIPEVPEKQAREKQENIKFRAALKQLNALREIPKILNTENKHRHRRALIIGNNNYNNLDNLNKAVGDADRMNNVLADLGFTVTLKKDVSRDEFDIVLNDFYETLNEGDIAFFFFAGHGITSKGFNYLLPVDVPKLQSKKELGLRIKREAINVSEIVTQIKERKAELAFVVLDACREDPFRRAGSRAAIALTGLSAMSPEEGIFIIYSAGVGQTALDELSPNDRDQNSIFTRKFWPILKTPGLPITDIAKRTQVEVRELANKAKHEQAPAYYDQVVGQFYFQPPKPRLFGLVIGVDEYNRNRILNGAVNDAKRISKALKSVGASEVVSIYDRNARRQFIDFAWRNLVNRANPGDTIVFSYAGASLQTAASNSSREVDQKDELLVLADFKWKSWSNKLAQVDGRLRHEDIDPDSILLDDTITDWMELAALKNINVILLVDGCHAGGLLDREFANVSFIGASDENEVVTEINIDGSIHGAMSVAFSNAIIGKADMNSDKFVSQRELFQYILAEVYRVIPEGQNPQFFPNIEKDASNLALFKTPIQKGIDIRLAPSSPRRSR